MEQLNRDEQHKTFAHFPAQHPALEIPDQKTKMNLLKMATASLFMI